MMTKAELRKTYLAKRLALSDSEYVSVTDFLTDLLLKRIREINPKVVHCFLPIKKKKEFNTFPLIRKLWDIGIEVAVPVSDFNSKKMKSAHLHQFTELEEKNYGILEPKIPSFIDESSIDLILVPLLVADNSGNRIGYGGGFYDRFLARHSPYSMGISFFPLIEDIPEINKFDIALDEVISL